MVVKASGLAAGKGVLVPPPNDIEAALKAVDEMFHPTNKAFGAAGDVVVIEQLLTGPEISLFAFCDGTTARCMLPAQDHKRAHDGDRGPNTGGMGAYAPSPQISAAELKVAERIMQEAVTGLKKDCLLYTSDAADEGLGTGGGQGRARTAAERRRKSTGSRRRDVPPHQ